MGKPRDQKREDDPKTAESGRNLATPEAVRPMKWNKPWLPDIQLSIMVAMAMLNLYLKTLHPSVAGGDSGELITSAYEVGVAHPPGYPLFTMMAKLMIELLPMSNPAWRVNLLTAVFSAASAGFIMLTLIRLTGHWSSGVLTIALFSTSRLTWQYSLTAEVFALNNLFISILLTLAVWLESCRGCYKAKAARWGSFLCGLSLCNQHTIIVYVIFIVIWALHLLIKQQRLTLKLLVELGVCFLCGCLPYLYLPITAYLRPGRWTWGDQTTLTGFMKHLLRQEYGTFSLAKHGTITSFTEHLWSYLYHSFRELACIGPPLAAFGLITAWKRYRRGEGSWVCIMSAMMAVYLVLFAWRCNLDMTNPLFYGVVERFWLQSNLIVSVLAGLGFDSICSYMSLYIKRSDVIRSIIPCFLLLFQVQRNWSICDESGNLVVYEFGKTIMDSMPPHAILLTKGDLPSNVLRYLHLCENYRPDLQVFDQEILTYSWSLPMLKKSYYKLKFPGDVLYTEDGLVHTSGGRSFTFKSLLDHNYDRHPIFACIGAQEYEPSWLQDYELWPFGVCSKFVKKGTELPPETWAKMTGNFAMHWTHPYQRFDPTSWERVANDEMWNAKISTANLMYERGIGLKHDSDLAASYLQQAYKLYLRAMDNNPEYPTFWHKNFALVCQMLIYSTSHDIDRLGLVEETMRQFTIYIEEIPAEEDDSIATIKTTISALQDYRDTLVRKL